MEILQRLLTSLCFTRKVAESQAIRTRRSAFLILPRNAEIQKHSTTWPTRITTVKASKPIHLSRTCGSKSPAQAASPYPPRAKKSPQDSVKVKLMRQFVALVYGERFTPAF